jgi:hypothetical protein
MPNFFSETGDHRFGLLTRVSADLTPPSDSVYGGVANGLRYDALPIHYDHDEWLQLFGSMWPEGSDAYLSYYERLLSGPCGFLPQQAAREGVVLGSTDRTRAKLIRSVAKQQDAAPTAPAKLPRILEKSFAPPKEGLLVEGTLTIEHQMRPINLIQQYLLGIVPPAGQLRTIVQHSKDEATGKVTWLRLFDGGKSTFATVWSLDSEPWDERFAGMVDIAQRLELDGSSWTLRHVSTSLRGVVPLPVSMMETRCVMSDFKDDGYVLDVKVTLLGLPMVRYSGRLKECSSDFLVEGEVWAMRERSERIRQSRH